MDSNILILGASGGIGAKLCEDLLANNCNLFLAEHQNPIKAKSIVGKLRVDATDFNSVQNFVEQGITQLGTIDGIVNLVGNLILKPAHRSTELDFSNSVNLNLKSSFAIIKSAGALLDNCSIVLMSTAASKIGLANHELICMAKSGIEGLAKSAAKTYSRKNIRVNTVSPGLVETPLSSGITQNPIALKASQKMHALGRIGKPKDISNMITYLLHKENNWITGQDFIVDGGLSSTK